MINTLIKIGETIRTNEEGRVKYHPMLKKINLIHEKSNYKNYKVFKTNIDLSLKTLEIETDAIPVEDVVYLDKLNKDKSGPYLTGTFFCTNNKNSKNKINLTLDNLRKNNINNQLLIDVGTLMVEHSEIFNSIILENNYECAFLLYINEVEWYKFPGILDTLDEYFINKISKINKNNKLTLTRNIYNFYATFNKESSKNSLSQSPGHTIDNAYKSLNLTFCELKNFIYGIKMYEKNLYLFGDYTLTLLPYSDNLNYSLIDKFISGNKETWIESLKKDNKENFYPNEFNKEFDMLNQITCNDLEENKYMNFILVVKKKQGSWSISTLLTVNNYNFSKLLKYQNKIDLTNNLVYGNTKFKVTNLSYAFNNFFKGFSDNNKKYNSFVVKWVFEIINEKYYENNLLLPFFINKFSHQIRNTESKKITTEYNNFLNQFKFLKLMEKDGQQSLDLITNSKSFLLGKEMGSLFQTWQVDRENLVTYVKNFTGYIEKKIISLEDIIPYFNDFISRAARNKVKVYPQLFLEAYSQIEKKEFNKNEFIFGYFSGHYSYNK